MATFGSLFAGIGGIDLGLERAGWTGRWQVEYDPYCTRVLAKHWPDVQRYGDITTVDWSGVERVDLLAGGFPCQPVSAAGRRLAQDDARWLWPEFLRAIRALRPSYVLVENVPGLLSAGFGEVLGDLAESGYDADWDCIPAAVVGAPHLRDRIFVVAYAESHRLGAEGSAQRHNGDTHRRSQPPAPDPAGKRSSKPGRMGIASDPAASRVWAAGHVVDGGWWATEPDVGRVAHGVPSRVDRLRALGNAVVPQVVEVIGRRLLEVAEGESVA